jgi:hypothetical protein
VLIPSICSSAGVCVLRIGSWPIDFLDRNLFASSASATRADAGIRRRSLMRTACFIRFPAPHRSFTCVSAHLRSRAGPSPDRALGRGRRVEVEHQRAVCRVFVTPLAGSWTCFECQLSFVRSRGVETSCSVRRSFVSFHIALSCSHLPTFRCGDQILFTHDAALPPSVVSRPRTRR